MFDSIDWPARVREISSDMTDDLDDFDDAPGNGFHACPCCHGTGYEAVAEDEVAPCTHIDCTVRDNRPVKYSRSCGSCGGGIDVNQQGFCKSCATQLKSINDDAAFRAGHYGLSRAEYQAMYERQQVELDGFSWKGRKRSPWYRGYEG